MKPLLMRSELTGSVYVVTQYKREPGGVVVAQTKYDVTEQFNDLVRQIDPLRSTEIWSSDD